MFPQIVDSKLPSELMLTFLDMMERSTWVEAQQSHKDHLTLKECQTLSKWSRSSGKCLGEEGKEGNISNKHFITIWVERNHVLGAEHLNTERVVSEVDPDLEDPELRHGQVGLLPHPLPVVLGDELLGVELGQAEPQVNLPELIVEHPPTVQSSPVSQEVLAEYL